MNRRKWLASTAILGASNLLFRDATPYASIMDHWNTEPSKKIYLGANENPYGPSEKAKEAMKHFIEEGHRYPVALGKALREKISEKYGLKEDYVVIGAGSSEILSLLANWCLFEKLPVIAGDISFPILPAFVKKYGGEVISVPMTSKKGYDLEALFDESRKKRGLIYLVNPNNPTGTKLTKSEIVAFSHRVTDRCYLAIDEAYIEYLGEEESCMDLIAENPKGIIIKTFSKMYGLAGMRIGYGVAHPTLAALIRKQQAWPSMNISVLGLAAASASMEDTAFVQKCKKANEKVKVFTQKELRKLDLLSIDSFANFIYYRCNPTSIDIPQHFEKHNIMVGVGEVNNEQWMRLTLGTMEEMETFISVAKSIWT